MQDSQDHRNTNLKSANKNEGDFCCNLRVARDGIETHVYQHSRAVNIDRPFLYSIGLE